MNRSIYTAFIWETISQYGSRTARTINNLALKNGIITKGIHLNACGIIRKSERNKHDKIKGNP